MRKSANWKGILMLVVLVFSQRATAQTPTAGLFDAKYVSRVWNNESGLLQNTVYDILADDDNYLWIANEEGLQRFDGQQFTNIHEENTPGLYSASFRDLAPSINKGIWAASRNTVLFIAGLEVTSYDLRKQLNGAQLLCMTEDKAGTLWAGSSAGDLFSIRQGKIQTFLRRQGLPFTAIQALQVKGDSLLLGTNTGLYCTRPGQAGLQVHPGGQGLDVRCIATDARGNTWLGTLGAGLVSLPGGRRFSTTDGLKDNSIFSLSCAPTGELWIGTRGAGVQVMTNGRFFSPMDQTSLRDPVRSIFHAGRDAVWFGSTGSGLFQLKPAEIRMISEKAGLSSNIILPIYELPGGEVWVGTAGKGINRILNGKVSHLTKRDGLASDIILSIGGNEQYLYIGTADGLNRFDLRAGRIDRHYTTSDGMASNLVQCVFLDSRKRVWVTTRTGGIHLLLPDGGIQRFHVPPALAHTDFLSVFEDRKGMIWIGTGGAGLVRVEASGRLTRFGPEQGLSAQIVECFYEDAAGSLWLGTEKGLVLVGKQGFRLFTKSNGLKFSDIYRMVDDGKGYLWLSGNFGIQSLPLQQLSDAKRQSPGQTVLSAKLYSVADGMANAEANGGIWPAGWRMRNGDIWFPTVEGIAVVQPDHISNAQSAPVVKIEGIRFGNVTHRSFDELSVPPGFLEIEIDYTAVDFSKGEDIRFYYRISGASNQWVAADSRRTAYFYALNPGTYTFELRAEKYGKWSDVSTVQFTVAPFFYQTAWFKSALVLLLLAALLFQVRFQRKRTERKVQEQQRITMAQVAGQERERQHIGSELHDNINQQLTTVRLYLDLAASDKEQCLAMVRKSERLVNNVISEIRSLSKQLLPPAFNELGLEEALQELFDSVVITGKIDIHFIGSSQLNGLDEEMQLSIYRIVQEQLNNVLKYAQARNVIITVKRNDQQVQVTVQDDGVGFDTAIRSKGVGLRSISNRLELFKGSSQIFSSPGNGCTLQVSLPLKKKRSVRPRATLR